MTQVRDAKKSKKGIINSATKLFAKHGIDGVSVDLIAKDANINKAMIYYYFKNKATLYETAIENLLDNIYKTILQEANRCTKPRDELKAFIITFAKFAKKNTFLSSLMLQELSSGGKNLPDDMFMGLKKLFLLLSNILKRGRDKGCFKEVKPMIIHFMITGVINLFITTKEMRKNISNEFGDDVCSSCDEIEIANDLYEDIITIIGNRYT